MNYAANKAANFEVGQIFGSKPFKVVNQIPFTSISKGKFDKYIIKGFDPDYTYPLETNQYNIKDVGMDNKTLQYYRTLQKQ